MRTEQIIELSNLAKSQGGALGFKRKTLEYILKHQDKTFLGILGPRGVGKTVALKQAHAVAVDSIYISLDTLERETDLFALVQELSTTYRFKTFFLDEVHFLQNIDRDLKKIFDFLDLRLFFTSSVSLKLIESAHDLARRIKLIELSTFNFREFLEINSLPVPAPLRAEDFISLNFSAEHAAVLPYFKRYISGGNFPFSLQVTDIIAALRNNIEKIVRSDIPKLKRLEVHELDIILKVFKFIARASVSDINPNVIAQNLKITRYKATQYLDLLEQAFIIKQIPPLGTNVLKEPKVLMQLPYRLLELDYDSAIGGLREDFAVNCLAQAGLQFGYLKSTTGKKTPDFLVEFGDTKAIIEIGGKGKGRTQFKGLNDKFHKIVFADQTQPSKNKIPLAYLGLLEMKN